MREAGLGQQPSRHEGSILTPRLEGFRTQAGPDLFPGPRSGTEAQLLAPPFPDLVWHVGGLGGVVRQPKVLLQNIL